MPEGSPRFESFEKYHNPEREDFLHNPELALQGTCNARVNTETYDTKETILPKRAIGTISCESCSVRGNLYGERRYL